MSDNKNKVVYIEEFIIFIFKKLKEKYVIGEFRIPEESIIKFLTFYTIAKYIQQNDYRNSKSIRQIHLNRLVGKRYKYNYDKLHDFHSKINQRNTYRLKINKARVKMMSERELFKSKAKLFNATSTVDEFNMFQLDMFFNLHNSKKYSEINTTYNRIRRNNIHKIKYKNLVELNDYIKLKIDKSKIEYKNIEYYILEQTIMKELITSMSYCYNKIKNVNTDREIISMFIDIAKIPIIDARHTYLDIYANRDYNIYVYELEIEVKSLSIFLNYCIKTIYSNIEVLIKRGIDIKYDKRKFKQIYLDDYNSTYKLRKDFTSDDYSKVMKLIHEFNSKAVEQLEESLKI